ncbi:FKBP-type peptidyl-prolyl cis-trans isomerase [Nocardia huaxiensis]|uniref:Peptidyl-prolyl cis-trans isomerase n=1 Tax=Nocardia huaxiensis TaxID=2755382 RepID=A0A7D6ZGB6_9NOCA|nr:FKBP-type peptidyl-prolyl cis-trans isomerase [Nocardia huaxiensis]QLY30259.1 FKBP-type peptidyl-prolyl cis-trans isomerase [Nocardia huaxiensis]
MRFMGKVGIVAAAALVLAGCGGSDENKASATSTTKASVPAAAGPTVAKQKIGKECTAEDIGVEGGFGVAPTITIPDSCDPPTGLIVKDLEVGSGPAAAVGQPLEMNYTLVTWSDKKKLDSSFDRGKPFTLTLGGGQVIQGWDEGLVGVQQGSRRLLIIPPDLGYGAGGRGIQPNETLVFVTDAVKVG